MDSARVPYARGLSSGINALFVFRGIPEDSWAETSNGKNVAFWLRSTRSSCHMPLVAEMTIYYDVIGFWPDVVEARPHAP